MSTVKAYRTPGKRRRSTPVTPRKMLRRRDVEEERSKLKVSSLVVDTVKVNENDSRYVNRPFSFTEMPNYLRMEYLRRLTNPRIKFRSGKFNVYGANSANLLAWTGGEFMMAVDNPAAIATNVADSITYSAYETPRHAWGDPVASISTSGQFAAAAQGGNFKIPMGRQKVMQFYQFDQDTLDDACSKIRQNGALSAAYNYVAPNLANYTGGINGEGVLVRGINRKITFTNMSANTLIFRFYECSCIRDTNNHPLYYWEEGLTTTLSYDIFPMDTNVSTDPSDTSVINSAITVDGQTFYNKNKYQVVHPGMAPDHKGLITMHQYWKVSEGRTVKVAHGEKLIFDQNHNGGMYQKRDHNTRFFAGLSKATIVVIQGKGSHICDSSTRWQGIALNAGGGEFAMEAETTTYYEGQIPVVPDTIMYTDAWFRNHPGTINATHGEQVVMDVESELVQNIPAAA